MDDRVGSYQRTRRKFAAIVYGITFCWLLLALTQWLIVNLVQSVSEVFLTYEWISVIFFLLSILLAFVFIFVEKARYVICLNWLITILIVEFAIIGLFALVVKPVWTELILWYCICMLLLFIFVLLGSVIPHDLTLDIVILFVISFVFLIASVFLIMLHVMTKTAHSFILYQLFVSSIVLTFVMYHAQTINGGRFAEMRVNDFLLATIILLYDFIVLFLLTFYAQTQYIIAMLALSPDDLTTPTTTTETTTELTTVDDSSSP